MIEHSQSRLARAVGLFIERRPGAVLLACVVISALAVFGATKVTFKTDDSTFFEPTAPVFEHTREFGEYFGGDALFVVLEGDTDELLTPAAMGKQRELVEALSKIEHVREPLAPSSLLDPKGSSDLETLRRAALDADDKPQERVRVVFPDARHMLIVAPLDFGIDQHAMEQALDETREAVTDVDFGVETTVSGSPVVRTVLQEQMQRSMGIMLAASVVLMIAALGFAFKVRRRLLALPVVLVGVLWTIGAMGLLDVPMTMVTMAVMPILLGLGVDYAVQFHNRYEEELARGDSPEDGVIDAIAHIAPHVLTAVTATAIGFVVLLISDVPMIRDFGIMLALGVFLTFIAAMFLLIAVMYRRDRNQGEKLRVDHQVTDSPRLAALARFAIRRGGRIFVVGLLVAGIGVSLEPGLRVVTNFEQLMPQDVPELKQLQEVRDLSGGVQTINVMLEGDDVLDQQTLEWMQQFTRTAAKQDDDLLTASSAADALADPRSGKLPADDATRDATLRQLPGVLRDNLVSSDHTRANIAFGVEGLDPERVEASVARLERLLDKQPPPNASAVLAGQTVLIAASMDALTADRQLMTALGALAIFTGLLLIYRSWRKALAPLVPIVFVVGWGSLFMRVFDVPLNPLTVTLGALVLGIGTEFTVLLQGRYYEERAKGRSPQEAMERAVSRIGQAIIASGLTVTAGFGALVGSNFTIIRQFGAVTVIDMVLCLVSTLLVMPPLIVWLDRGPKVGPEHADPRQAEPPAVAAPTR